jgi:parallel beta-helix repeat protein
MALVLALASVARDSTPILRGSDDSMMKKNWDIIGIFLFGTGIFLVTVLVYADYFQPEWKAYQQEFREMVGKRYGANRTRQVPGGLQQMWARELNRVDRCTTCHQAVQWKGFENGPEPFRTHPREILEKHPIERYGCTSCHGGQGYATDMESAHATDLKDWEQPLLGEDVSKTYSVSDWRAPMQINCNLCHRYDRETPGADYINEAKTLVQQKGCRACHKINGRGGVIGPDLTSEGDKSTEQHDYSRLSGVESEFAWHVAHLKEPKAMAPGTVMPNFGFNTRQSQALSMLVMSWKRTQFPMQFVAGVKVGDFPTAEEKVVQRSPEAGRHVGDSFRQIGTDLGSRFDAQGTDVMANEAGMLDEECTLAGKHLLFFRLLVDEDSGILLKSSNNRIADNELRDVLFGIYLLASDHNYIGGNVIRGRPLANLGDRGSGIHIWNSSYNTLEGNTIFETRDGMYLQNAYHSTIRDNRVHDLRYGLHYM